MENLQKVRTLIGSLREELQIINQNLDAAFAKRDVLAMTPFPKADLIANLEAAVDLEAEEYKRQFGNHLQYLICLRKGKRIGINKSPDPLRNIGNYSQLNIEALHYFYAKEIKAGIRALVNDLNCPEGLNDEAYETSLKQLDAEIEQLVVERDALQTELEAIGQAR